MKRGKRRGTEGGKWRKSLKTSVKEKREERCPLFSTVLVSLNSSGSQLQMEDEMKRKSEKGMKRRGEEKRDKYMKTFSKEAKCDEEETERNK